MKRWLRSTGAHRCGSCGRQVKAEQPVQEIYLPALHTLTMQTRYRCVDCTDDAVPPDASRLPPAVGLVTRGVPSQVDLFDAQSRVAGDD